MRCKQLHTVNFCSGQMGRTHLNYFLTLQSAASKYRENSVFKYPRFVEIENWTFVVDLSLCNNK